MNFIKKNIKYLRGEMNQSDFADLFGLTRDNVASYERGTEPKVELMQKIVNHFHISLDEFINTDLQAEVEKDRNNNNIEDSPEPTNKGQLGKGKIPLIPIDAAAGVAAGDVQVMEYESEHFYVPTFAGADFLTAVRGSSMYPKYNSGDIIACKRLPLNTFFQWNKVYVLDTEQGALVKRVRQGSSDDYLLLVSDNEAFSPFEVHKSEVRSLAIVMGVIRLE